MAARLERVELELLVQYTGASSRSRFQMLYASTSTS